MTLDALLGNLQDIYFSIVVKTIIEDKEVTLFDGSAFDLYDSGNEILTWEIEYMVPRESKIIFDLKFEGDMKKISAYIIK